MSKSNEAKKVSFDIHNSLVDFFNPANTEKNVTLEIIQTLLDKYTELEELPKIDAVKILPAIVKNTIKGTYKKNDIHGVLKVVSTSNVRKALSCSIFEMVSTYEEMKQVQRKKAPSRALTTEEKLFNEQYRSAKNLAKIRFDATHLLDGTNKTTGIIEKFEFMTKEEFAKTLTA